MNSQTHRVIFNKSRGCMMAVSEVASSTGKGKSCKSCKSRKTDARFTGFRQWMNSDYMSAALSLDPTVTQKRLGDGFYEQRLIREQVSLLTGRRFAGNYTTDEQQYQGLMDGGITYAKAYNLRPGIALTAAQMAVLTTDIVWLVEQTITLADGSQTTAL